MDFKFSSLDWFESFYEYGLQNFIDLQKKIQILDGLSKFSQIPICNLSLNLYESFIKIIDISFARELTEKNCVWWYSESAQPDNGTKKSNFNYLNLNE